MRETLTETATMVVVEPGSCVDPSVLDQSSLGKNSVVDGSCGKMMGVSCWTGVVWGSKKWVDGPKDWTAGVGRGVVEVVVVVDVVVGVVVVTAGILAVLLGTRVKAGKSVDRPARADRVVDLPDSDRKDVVSWGEDGVELSDSAVGVSTLVGIVVIVAIVVVSLAGVTAFSVDTMAAC